MIADKKFFSRKAEEVARDLIGMKLVRNLEGKILSGTITAVEAHAKEQKRTPKFEGAYENPGRIHMYPAQGKYILAIATEDCEKYSEVSIRELKPLEGIEQMKKHRRIDDLGKLTDGPSKIVQALGITKDFEGSLMYSSKDLWIEGESADNSHVKVSKGKARDAVSYSKLRR